MDFQDKIDKEENLIRLTVGQVCSAGVAHNIYTGDRKIYAEPFIHKVLVGGVIGSNAVPYYDIQEKEVGLAIRISNDGLIVSNPSYRGHAIIAFLDKKYEECKIHTVRVIKVNKRSVQVEPSEYIELPKGKEK